jgi:hypothetical protein
MSALAVTTVGVMFALTVIGKTGDVAGRAAVNVPVT